MKKTLTLLLGLALAAPTLMAQKPAATAADSTAAARWRIGAWFGPSFNYHQAPQAYANFTYSPVLGISAGLTGKYSFRPWLAVRADLLSLMKNYTQTNSVDLDGETVPVYMTIHMNAYTLVPVTAEFSYGRRLRVHGDVGFYAGYWRVWARSGMNGAPLTAEEPVEYEDTVAFNSTRDNRFNAGLVARVGVTFPLGRHWEGMAEGACYYDLTDSRKAYMRNHFPHYNTTVTGTLGVAYKF